MHDFKKRRQTFIVGVGCTAFVKVSNYSPPGPIGSIRLTQKAQGTESDRGCQSILTDPCLKTKSRLDGTGGCDQSATGCGYHIRLN